VALKIYSYPDPEFSLSTDGSGKEPLRFTFDGSAKGAISQRFYVRNDNTNKWYSNISVDVVPGAAWMTDGSLGWSWKLYPGYHEPFPEEWIETTEGSVLSLSDIGTATLTDVSTFLPFWIRIESPDNTDPDPIDGTRVRIISTEWAV
jgi:hypothetical protein